MTEDNRNKKPAGETPGEDRRMEDSVIEGEVIEEGVESQPIEENLEQALDQARSQAQEFFEGWQRERADFANYKRRIERDQQATAQNMKGELVKKYLPVLDDMERALKARPTEGGAAAWANGIELIYRKLQSILESEGVMRIPAESEAFNPLRHEAITHEDSPNHKSGEIIEVVQQGYTLGERVLRPSLVRVAR
jgi:molecular chaperone GrpE